MRYILSSIVIMCAILAGCNKSGSNGPSQDTRALLDAVIVTESYNAVKENPDSDVVVPNSTKHNRADCPNGGWITQGDGHKSRCPDCEPAWNSDVDNLEELRKQVEIDKQNALKEVEAAKVAALKAAEEAKAQLDAEVKAKQEAEAKAKLEAEQKAATEASIKAGVEAEQNEHVPTVGEQLAIEAAKMKLEREARAAAEAKAAELEAKVKEAEAKALAVHIDTKKSFGQSIRMLDNDTRYNLLREEVDEWNRFWKGYKTETPTAKINKEASGPGVKPVPPSITFDPALDWRLPLAERKKTFEQCKISWKTPNKKCCPDCTCETCYCMYPGQCLVEANGGNPVTKFKTVTQTQRQCSGGSCKNVNVNVQVPRITYKQPAN